MQPSAELWAALALALLGLLAGLWARGVLARLRLRVRMRRAAAGEREAEPLLERAGYRVRGRQVRAELEYAVDGEPRRVEVRADYVVEKGGLAWIAEVKTGREAPRLTTRATRRQLLEYAHAFDVAGVLLVDPERGRVHRVSVPERARPGRPLRDAAVLALGALLGATIVLALRF